MKFTDYLFEESKEIWQGYLEHPFVVGMGEGNLDKDKFLNYLIQDYLYLIDYAKVFCMGVVKASSMEEMRFFYKSTAGTLDAETDVHIEYMKELGVDPKEAENYKANIETISYTSYMNSIALTGGIKEITMAILPCTWSYNYIGKYLFEKYKDNIDDNYYSEWIKMYAGEGFTSFADEWIDYTNKICENITDEEKMKLKEIFIRSSVYEMEFWNMANKEVEKEVLECI